MISALKCPRRYCLCQYCFHIENDFPHGYWKRKAAMCLEVFIFHDVILTFHMQVKGRSAISKMNDSIGTCPGTDKSLWTLDEDISYWVLDWNKYGKGWEWSIGFNIGSYSLTYRWVSARNDHGVWCGWGGCVVVPDSDRGDFRHWHVDISSLIWLEVFLSVSMILKKEIDKKKDEK